MACSIQAIFLNKVQITALLINNAIQTEIIFYITERVGAPLLTTSIIDY